MGKRKTKTTIPEGNVEIINAGTDKKIAMHYHIITDNEEVIIKLRKQVAELLSHIEKLENTLQNNLEGIMAEPLKIKILEGEGAGEIAYIRSDDGEYFEVEPISGLSLALIRIPIQSNKWRYSYYD